MSERARDFLNGAISGLGGGAAFIVIDMWSRVAAFLLTPVITCSLLILFALLDETEGKHRG